MSFGKAIRKLRTDAGKTLKEVAEALDLKLTRLSDIEHERRGPFSPSRIRVFSEFLGVEEKEHELIRLASESSDSIEIKTSKNSQMFNEVAFALARKSSSDSNDVDNETWGKILELLNK